MRLSAIEPALESFRTSAEVMDPIRRACEANPDVASFHELGSSREGRPIYGVALGYGPRLATLMAGAHADEPVGPETLRTLILEALGQRDWLADEGGFADLFQHWTLRIIPHVNPDGEARNQGWIAQWPSVASYITHRVRERPGDDIEFGFPVMRPENRTASRFLFDYSPVSLHMSLHGLGFGEGALLLIERHWAERVDDLTRRWRSAVDKAGLRLHDHDRGGQKGFHYYGPGFWSTPEGAAMRRHFREQGDEATARLFFHSSMEWARATGYHSGHEEHPLALVTELPLFVIDRDYEHRPGVPAAYLALQEKLSEVADALRRGEDVGEILDPFKLRPLDLDAAIRLQLTAIELGMTAVAWE